METQGKQFEVVKWVLVAIALFMVYKLLNKFGLLGKTDDEKATRALETGNVGKDIIDTPDAKKAVQLATRTKKPSKQQILKIISDSSTMARLSQEIIKAKGTLNDDEDAVYNAFRILKSQFDVQMFARFFLAMHKKDLFAYLNSFLNSEELAKVQQIIKDKKPA